MPDALILTGSAGLQDALNDAHNPDTLLLLDPAECYADSVSLLLARHADKLNGRLYVPEPLAAAAPGAYVLAECTPFSAPLKSQLLSHRQRWKNRAAVLIRPNSLSVTLSGDSAAKIKKIDHSLIVPNEAVRFSSETGYAYTVCTDHEAIVYTLFYSEQSFVLRRTLCQELRLPMILLEN